MTERNNEIPLSVYCTSSCATVTVELKKNTFNVASSMNVSIFSSPMNISKSLWKPSHSSEFVLSSSIFVKRKSANHIQSIRPRFNIDCEQFSGHDSEQESHVTGRHNANNQFFLREKVSMLWTTETTIFIRIIARAFT